jgi:hypothetical protein
MKLQHVFFLLATLAAGPVAADDPGCPDQAERPAHICIASAHGLAYADTRKDADMGAHALEGAALQFPTYFGTRAPTGVLVLSGTYTTEAARDFAASQSLGYGLSWLPESASPMSRRDSRTGRSAGRQRVRRGLHENVLRHELGHAMYAAMFWPDASSDTPAYGSPAPDWLDEAAALLMEMPGERQRRDAAFLATFRASPGKIPPLAAFVRMPHPALALQEMMRRFGETSRSGVVSMKLPAGAGLGEGLDIFYGQAGLFARFLIDLSGDRLILRSISEAAVAGVDFETWLAQRGDDAALPRTLTALQARWEAWLGHQ